MGNCVSKSGDEQKDGDNTEATFFRAAHSNLHEVPHEVFDCVRLEHLELQANLISDIPKVCPCWR